MNPFSSKPKNRRCRPLTRKVDDFWKTTPATESTPKKASKLIKAAQVDQQAFQLNARIGALESFIARKAHADIKRIQMKRDNILPPPDMAARPGTRKKKLSHAERRRYHAERSRNGIQFFLLFCGACALVWWLIFSGV